MDIITGQIICGFIVIIIGILIIIYSKSSYFIKFAKNIYKITSRLRFSAHLSIFNEKEKEKMTKIILRIFGVFLVILGFAIVVIGPIK